MNHEIPSLRDIPSPVDLEERAKTLAILDAILMPDWEYRYFSFNIFWDQSLGERMASMKDGCGSECYMLFSETGCACKILSSQKLNNFSHHLANMPDDFRSFKNEAAFELDKADLFLWRRTDSFSWHSSPSSPQEIPLMGFFSRDLSYYHAWAEDYYEKPINYKAIKNISKGIVDNKNIRLLNPESSLGEIKNDMISIFG